MDVEKARPLRLWTFHEPMEGPMAVDINGCYFECDSASINRIESDRPLIPVPYKIDTGYDYEITVTFKLRVQSKQNPTDIVYQVEDVPPSVRLR